MFLARRLPIYPLPLCALLILGSGCLLRTDADAEGREVLSSPEKDQGVVTLPPEDMGGDDMTAPEDMPTPPVDMMPTAGGEGEQDNDGDGTCAPTCEVANLGCSGEQAACDDSSGAATCVPTPFSCAQASVLLETMDDGIYTLYVGNDPGKPWSAICVDMNTGAPKTYLPLGVNSGDSNRFEFVDIRETLTVGGTYEAIVMAVTTFWMVRIDPSNLRVDLDDFTFSVTDYYDNDTRVSGKQVPFGTAESCSKQIADPNNRLSARGKIDLTNTPFKIDQSFLSAGECPDVVNESSSDSSYTLRIDGGDEQEEACAVVGPQSYAVRIGSRCNGSVTSPSDTEGPEGFLQLSYEGGVPSLQEVPKTCLELKFANFSRVSGQYTLYADRDPEKPWTALCRGMEAFSQKRFPLDGRDGVIKEYLELSEQDGASNLMQAGGDASNSVSVETKYRAIRLDPNTFEVDVVDLQEADSTKRNPNAGESSVKYGIVYSTTAECCDRTYPGAGKVDLRGTGFVVDDTFDLVGNCPMGGVSFTSQGAVADLTVTGFPGTIIPHRGALNLGVECGNGPQFFGYYSETDFILRLAYP